MSGANRHYPMPMEQHPAESLPDETIPNDAPLVPSPEEHRRAIQDARARGTPVDSLPWPSAPSASHLAPVEQSPAESLPDEAIPNDAPPFHGSSTEGGNASNGLSTWPSSTQTSSADVSASSSAGHGTERPRLAPLTTIHGNNTSEAELMRSPNSAAPTEMPPPPYTRGQSSQAQTAIAAEPVSSGSGEFSPPQHNYPGLPPGVSPASGASVSGGSGSQDALIHGAMQEASSRALSGSEPGEAVALPKYSNRPQDGNRRVEPQPDGSYKMFPAEDPNAHVAMHNVGGSESTSERGAATEGTLVQLDGGEAQVQQEQPTRNPLRRFWRRHFKGPHNKKKRAWLISLIIFIIVLLVIIIAVLGAKKRLAGQGGDDSDDSDSDDDDDDDDDDE